MKKERGITLIALVVTIVVLLILAGVSISMLSGDDGILTRAQEAKNKTEEAEDMEKIGLAISEAQIGENGYQELDIANFQEALNNQFEGRNLQLTDNGDGSFIINLDNSKNYYADSTGQIISNKNIVSIGTAKELKTFRDDVNSGNTYEGKYVYLTNDITLGSSEEWEPIGLYPMENSSPDDDTNKPFKGIFDGRNHEINGIYINTTDKAQGLFGFISESQIKNLGLGENNNIKGGVATGNLVGYAYNKTVIFNCYNKSSLESESISSGGLIGILNKSTAEKSYNEGNITSTANQCGGIVGMATTNSTIKNCYNNGIITGTVAIGGIVGLDTNNSNVEQSYNLNNIISISTTNDNDTGGIIGKIDNGKIDSCYNKGKVTGSSVIGGILGRCNNNSKVMNCYNVGEIRGNENIGGISGIIGNYNETSMIQIENCYSAKDIIGDNDVGAIYGYSHNTITIQDINNYYLTNTVNGGNDILSKATPKTSDELKLMASILGSAFKEDRDNINNSYPILSWQ